jgi:hypothetical protein
MSKCPRKITGMKIQKRYTDDGEVIAHFGQARLIRHLDGKLELKGGSRGDRTEAREWMSLFWHEAVVAETPAS